MSMQYTPVSMGFTNSSDPSTQMLSHKTDTRQETGDMYAGRTHVPEANTTVNYGYDKVRKTSSPVSALSPPQSSVTGELPSQLSLEYICDSDSHQRDYSTCSQAYTRSRVGSGYGHAGSPESVQQNVSLSFASVDNQSMKNVLEELENALLGPVGDGADSVEFSGENNSFWTELLDEVTPAMQLTASDNTANMQDLVTPHGARQGVYQPLNPSFNEHSLESVIFSQGSRARTLLVMCALAIGENRMHTADTVMQELRKEVSVFGDPAQRLAAYMCEGLVARMHASGFALYRVLKCMDAPAVEVLSAMQKLYEICPYFKFAYMAANGAIAEALKNETKVHIFDFQIVQGTQWISLMQGLANRPGGPPCIRITTVEDPSAQGYPIGGMQLVRQRLSKLAESLKVPFEFNTIPCKLSELRAHMIEKREGEALAVNFTLQLHHVPDESVCVENPRDCTLRVVRELNPKVLTVVEQEANTNTTPFFTRFIEVLEYYTSIFESIDVVLPRESKDRVNVEEQCLAREIVNVVACEGTDRVERHELTGKWRARLSMAGFRPHPLSSYVNDTIRMLLKSYSEKYTLKEEGGALFLGWCNRPLVVATAWH